MPYNAIDDADLDRLTEWVRTDVDGIYCVHVNMSDVLLALEELRRYRDKPLHCPCCDGDHL